MTPFEIYQQKLASGDIHPDESQLPIMQLLDDIYQKLVVRNKKRHSTLGKIRLVFNSKAPVKGLYLWGSVGIGKTFMIDTFYDALPIKKMRLHFHKFMQQLQTQLRRYQGMTNPLQLIANKMSQKYLVICFDEFYVNNIADAMLLGEFFQALFAGGSTLITTSNFSPDNLYKEGLQREHFLPAIEAIKANTHVIHLLSTTDYRFQHLEKAGVFYTPLNAESLHNMEQSFKHFSHHETVTTQPLDLMDRKVKVVKRTDSTVWFGFKELCESNRSQEDYLAIAHQFHTVLISDIYSLAPSERNVITRFINLIDIFYDQHVRVVISSAVTINKIYPSGPAHVEFEHTLSRLNEMQSADYFYVDRHQRGSRLENEHGSKNV